MLKYIRPVIKLKDNQALVQAKASPAVIERSQYDVSLIAGMIVDKMLYHQPLHRQHQKLATNGITVSRGSLTQTFHRAAQLLEGIFDAMVRSILLSKVLAIDETPTKAGREGPGKMRQAYFWPIYGDQNEVAFIYCASRATKHVYDILQGYQGIVISDGYAAYQQYCEATQLTHAQCWVHTRRVFFEAQDAEPELCRHALDAIGALYEIEREIKSHGLTDQDKRRYRYERSLPLVERFFQWLKEQQTLQGLTPTNPFLKAAGYAIKREASLKVFLDHPDVPLDTNHIERTLRPITLGRKNWLFSWTEIGAHYIGVTQSLIASCRLHDVNPYDYLVDVLQRIDSHPMSQVDDLLPRNWKMQFADNPLRSDAYYFRTNKPVPIILQ